MNHMKEVVKMLGVELGEEFKIEVGGAISDGRYKITETGMTNKNGTIAPIILAKLLSGEVKLIKLPRKPKNGETIWFTTTDGAVVNDCFHSRFARDLSLYKLGRLYCTEAEAEAHREEDKAFWDEIRKELDR